MNDKTQKAILLTLIVVVSGTLLLSKVSTSGKDELTIDPDTKIVLPETDTNIADEDLEALDTLKFDDKETTLVLTDIAINTDFQYTPQEDVVITWRVPVEGVMKQAQFEGIGISTRIKRDSVYKIHDYIEGLGFNIDQNNIITEQYMESTGYFRNRTLCKVTQEVADLNPETGKPVNSYDARMKVTVACTYVAPN